MCFLRSGRDVNRRRGRLQVVDIVGGHPATTRHGIDPARDGDQHDGDDDRADRAGVRHPGGDTTNAAAAGSVNSHPNATFPPKHQCTDAAPRDAPAPKIEPVATCVVDSGKPRCEEVRMTPRVSQFPGAVAGPWAAGTRR